MPNDTLPKLFLKKCLEYGENKIAMHRKDYGIWNKYTWKDSHENVKYFSLGLISLGLKTQEKVIIIGDNDPEWFWAAFAVQSARGTVTGVFPDCTASELEYFVINSDAVFVIAEDQEQTDKVLEIKERNPALRKVIYWDPKGMYIYKDDPFVMDFTEVLAIGREYEKSHQKLFEKNVAAGTPKDIGVLLYTSGTTGSKPKGVMGSQAYLVAAGESWCSVDKWSPDDNYVSYISPAWGTEWIMGISSALREGTTIFFPEKPETVQSDIREVGPEIVFYSARLWEDLNAMIQMKISDSLPLFRYIFNKAIEVGYQFIDAKIEKKPISAITALKYKIADWIIFRQLRDRIGLANIKWAYTAGALISPEIVKFFHVIGVNFKQTYGLTEALTNTVHRDNEVRPETCGTPIPGNEIKISDSGELLVKPPVPFSGYYKKPKESKEMFNKEGWLKTGDSASIDKDGQLIVYGRLKELVSLGEDKMYSPEFMETRLRFSPYIKDAMTIGGHENHSFVTAIIIIHLDNMGKLAEEKNIAYTTFADLSQKPLAYELIAGEINHVNSLVPEWSKIQKFMLMPKEFDADEAELTRTKKLRRKYLAEKYSDIVEALFSNAKTMEVKSEIAYKDGRTGFIKNKVQIISV